MSKASALILAAGQGKRMKSKLPKVLHPVCGQAMIEHVMEAAAGAGLERQVLVVGYQGDKVVKAVGDQVEYVWQREPAGTGHAVQQARGCFEENECIVVLCGDTPLLTAQVVHRLLESHRASGAAATVLTVELEDPSGYGRIVRGEDGEIKRIVEETDASSAERGITEVNTGIYCFQAGPLFRVLRSLQPENAQGEYYLTDVLALLQASGHRVKAVQTSDRAAVMGVNTRQELARADRMMREQIIDRLMSEGVTVVEPSLTFVHKRVSVGKDTVLHPHTYLLGDTIVGEGATIGPSAQISNSHIGDGALVWYSVVVESEVGAETTVGPFAYLRPGTRIGRKVRIGDFVEVKNSRVGNESKIPHLSYIGDTDIGDKVNIGAGVIVVNYDGLEKHRTHIGDQAFVGCNSNLIAPVKVGARSYIGAGSTINQDVPEGALGIGRGRQVNKEGWADRFRERRGQKNQARRGAEVEKA